MNPSSVPQPRIPLAVAALAPKMMAHAARHADIWNTMSFEADFSAQDDDLLIRLVTELSAIGFTDICLTPPSQPEQLPAVERIANQVLPGLRASHGARHQAD